MSEIKNGSLVLSLKGKDRGKIMYVVGASGRFILVCDGKKRKIISPKRKNPCHLRVLPSYDVPKAADAELTDGVLRRYLNIVRKRFYTEQSSFQ